jgi:hypothetical protein
MTGQTKELLLPVGDLPGDLTRERAEIAAHEAARLGYTFAEIHLGRVTVLIRAKLLENAPSFTKRPIVDTAPPRLALFGQHERDTSKP